MNYSPNAPQNTVAVYHAKKADMRAQLQQVAPKDGVFHIVSVENKYILAQGGQVSPVTLENAARCIVEGTHQLATSEQIERFHAEDLKRTEEYQLIEAKRNKQTVIMLQNTDLASLTGQQPLSGLVKKGKE